MNPRCLEKPVLSVPAGIEPQDYYRSLLGPLALGVSLGIQVTLTGFLLLGPASGEGRAERLTEFGKAMTRPEHDLAVYIAGVLLTLVAAAVAVWYWRAKLACLAAADAAETMRSSGVLQTVLAVASLATFLPVLCSSWFSHDLETVRSAVRPALDPSDALPMLLPGVVALLCAIFDLECAWSMSAAAAGRFDQWWRRINACLRYAVPLLIVLLVGVPPGRWGSLAGQFFESDGCHHLSFFMMAPALAFSHGKAFGTEIYSQYGLGWPLVASLLSPAWVLTYGRLVGLEIAFGCVYYLGMFFVLRLCFKTELWAAFAVILAIYWQLFTGMSPSDVIWQYPSSTMMRHPLDVWFFLALVMLQRSGAARWAALAGLAAALGVFFETETGVYLLVTFLVYLVLQAGVAAGERRAGGAKGWLVPLLTFCAAAALAILPLLLYASRGTLFSAAFWRGWLEAFVVFAGQGVSALPMAELPDAPLIAFSVMATLYLAVIAYALIQGWHRNAGQGTVLLATIAAYGLALLLVFVNRSHPFNLCHETAPFAVVLTALIIAGYQLIEHRLVRSSLPYALVGGLVLLLLTKAEFQRYPSFLEAVLTPPPAAGLSLRSNPTDLSGLPSAYEQLAREFRDTCSAMRALAPDGNGVAVLDPNDTPFYAAANACPWSRYGSLFRMALTQSSLDGICNDLLTRLPPYVVIRGERAPRSPQWEFVWAPLYEAVTNRYVLHQTVGGYEIWRRANHS